MLVTPPRNNQSIGTIENALINVISGGFRDEVIREGLILMGHWNPEFIFRRDSFHNDFKHKLHLNPMSIIAYKRMAQRARDRGITDDNRYLLDMDTDTNPLEVYRNYRKPLKKKDEYDDKEQLLFLETYGVCDSPEQLLSIYDFEKDKRKLFICFVEIRRDDQPSDGGWRYHKWGEYVGEQNPQNEYIYYDKHIEKVYTYHVYELKD
jgi:hypothetical protein